MCHRTAQVVITPEEGAERVIRMEDQDDLPFVDETARSEVRHSSIMWTVITSALRRIVKETGRPALADISVDGIGGTFGAGGLFLEPGGLPVHL